MKKNIVFSLAICLCLPAFSQTGIDVLHYRYEISLNDKNDTIYCKAIITLAKPSLQQHYDFDLTSLQSSGKGMIVDSIRGHKRNSTVILPQKQLISHSPSASHVNDKLNWSYNAEKFNTTGSCDTDMISIWYHGIPDDGLIISKNKYGHRTFFSDNWPNRAHNWIPCIDDPSDKASVEFLVTAPDHYRVVSNGRMVEEKKLDGNRKLTHYKEDIPLPTKVMVIGVAGFAVDSVGAINNVPVYSWVFPENKSEGFYDYAPAKEILSFYMDYIGPYAYQKLANVQSKTIFGGMENASAIFYYENSVTGKREQEALLAHEIVHQWFGNMATEKNFAHIWLSEGFATYLTHIYLEKKYGTDSLEKRMKKERQEIIGFLKGEPRPVIDTTKDYMQLLNANSYQKGGWILHMLRRQLGDSVFRRAIQKYYADYAGKNADSDDLRKIFEEVSGKDLKQFFYQWLTIPANPRLSLEWKYNPTKKNITLTVKQLHPEALFHFPLEILVQEKALSMPKRSTITITKSSETFVFPVSSRPVRVEADPMVSLLYEGKVTEIK
ncbi:MAG: M1 family aminopeptidase [Chitinophagaceae bacterium]